MPLSPNTPPGTHVVVTWLEKSQADVLGLVKPQYRAYVLANYKTLVIAADIFQLGRKHVLSAICPCEFSIDGFHCHLVGVKGSYSLRHFDVAQLPKAITDLLVSKPVDDKVHEMLRWLNAEVL